MKTICFVYQRYHPKIIENILKNVKKQVRLFKRDYMINDKEMKNRSHRQNINRPRRRHGHKYTKYKLYLSVMMVICTKQHLKLNL